MAARPAEDGQASILDEISKRAPEGIVLPPRAQRTIIEKTAGYVARNGASFEAKLRENPKLTFTRPEDAYYAYYRWRVEDVQSGRSNALAAGREGETGVSTRGREERKIEPPEEYKFSARMPNINAQDLEIVKLTAVYAAKNGTKWAIQLSQREAGNFQFDFLRPQHSLHQFYSRLVDQYTDLLNGKSVDGGKPQQARIARLQSNVDDRFHVLDKARKRAEYTKYVQAQKVAKEEQEEKERIQYAQIDWHDFSVVATVVFDEADENTELPPPTRLNDLQSASLEQRAKMTIVAHRRIEEAMPTFEDDYPQPPQQPAPAVQTPQPSYGPQATPPIGQNAWRPPGQDDEQTRAQQLQADRERARAAQEAARAAQPLKIRSDYVPRAKAKQQAQNTSICPNCGQPISNDEMADHIRIEMLDPQWREQSRIAQQRSSTTNLSTADVANNLKRLASQRSDLFDPITGQAITPEEQARRKRAELQSYDGQTAPAPAGQERPDVQEQIRQLHQRYNPGGSG